MKNKVNSKLIHISLNKFKFVLILVIFLYSNLSFAQTPTSADNTVSINEDNDKVFIAGDFSYSDPNGDPFTQIMITGLESTGTLFYDADNDNVIDGGENVVINQIITVPNIPRLKFRPNSNESGVSYDSFDFQINDGNDGNSALSYTMTIDIILVNDEPSFTLGANQTVNEDVGAQTVAAWATVINRGAPDEAAQTLTFHLTNNNNGLFSVQPSVSATGTLTYTPTANANGSATVTIWLTDNGGTANGGDDTSPTYSFTITVNAVNDPPTSSANAVTTFENSNYTFILSNFAYSDVESNPFNRVEITTAPGSGSLWVDSDNSGTINGAEVVLSAGNNVTVANISANRLKFMPVSNQNGTPYTSFNFRVDDGIEYSTLSYLMTINVTGINSEPSFTLGANQTVNEDAGAQTVAAWATVINRGAPDEAAQTLTFHLTNNNNGLFSVQPSVSATGILTYTPTANANGSATVTIWLTDDGGTANGGDDTSPTYSFTITVNAINDIPTLVINTGKIVLEAAGSQVISNSELQYIDVDHISSEIVYTLTSSTSNGTLYNGVSALSATNTFTQQDIDNGDINYTHNGGETTTDNFQFTVADILGGTVLGVQTFNLTITPVNDSPVFVSTPSNFGAEGVLYTYNITTTDSDLPANALTITAPIKPIWLTLSDNGDGTAALFGTPPDGAARSNSIIINVNDASVNIQQSYTLVLSYDISVPGNYPTIQQAIDASVDGDIISVSNGLYPENINFNGKEVELIGNSANPALVIIDGGLGSGAAVTFENGESASTSINGFTIQNGTGHSGVAAPFSRNAPSSGYYGGGIFIYQSSPLLKNIIVENNTLPVNNNHGGSGGGIYIGNNSNVTIEGPNTIIRNNNATIYRGGGICIDNSTVNIDGILAGGVLIENNNGGNYGGGISSFESTLNLTNVTIISNIVDGANGTGGGVYSLGSTLNQNMGTIINANSATVGSNDIQTF